jgi:hypothetical protein
MSCVIEGKWHLVKGKALYDVSNDLMQRGDISSKAPRSGGKVVKFIRGFWGIDLLVDDSPLFGPGEPVGAKDRKRGKLRGL